MYTFVIPSLHSISGEEKNEQEDQVEVHADGGDEGHPHQGAGVGKSAQEDAEIPMPGDDIGVVLGLFDESIPKGLEVDGVSFSGGVI